MSQTIFDWLFALAALVAILDYFGFKPKQPHWGPSMPLNRNWKLGIMLVLVAASLGMSGFSFYRSLHPPSRHFSTSEWENYQSAQVIGKRFAQTRVTLDGSAYINCEFDRVTLVYNGTAPFRLLNNHFTPPVQLDSEVPEIEAALELAVELERNAPKAPNN